MFDNDNKESFIKTYTDEELKKLQQAQDDEEVETIEDKDEVLASVTPSFGMIKANIEQILARKNFEDSIVALVDSILLDEQTALKEETKQEVQIEKYVLGKALAECNCFGDQKNFLLLMASRLGYRPI